MAIVKSWKGVCVNFAGGNNKWWKAELHDNGDVVTRWGKIVNGAEDQGQTKTFYGEGESKYNAKIKEKMNKSNPDDRYAECKTLDNVSASSTPRTAQGGLLEIAKRQIKASNSETLKLIEYLVQTNIHNITSHTTIHYNKDTGLFQTPMGIVTSEAIDEARALLSEIGLFVSNKDFDNSQFLDTAQKYFRLIPKDFGRITRFKSFDLFPDFNSVSEQNNILDSLEVSVQSAINSDKPVVDHKEEKMFDVTLELLDNQKEIQRITDKYMSTLNRGHQCAHLRVRKVWSLGIKNMQDAFERDGKKLANQMELWHGSKVSNVLSIMKSGFRIPAKNAPHVTGALFGAGIYMAIQSTKSLNYAYGYWSNSGARDDSCFMFLVDAGLGNFHVPKYLQQHVPQGYDSLWARPGQSGIQNDEIIVPRTSMCNPTYLIQFGR